MWACGTVTAGKTGLEHYIIIMTQENGLGRKTALTRLTEGFTRHQVVLLVNPFTPSLPLPSLSLSLSEQVSLILILGYFVTPFVYMQHYI